MRFTCLMDGLVTDPTEPSHVPAAAAWARDASEMKAIADGDTIAFARVYRAHHPKVFRTAFGVLGDREDARDVAHECFLKLQAQAARWEPRARIDTWLYRVAVHTCLSWRRRLARMVLSPSRAERAEGETRSDEASPQQRAEQRARIDEVRATLASLSPRDRALVVLHVDQDLQPQEIAPLVGLSENATRVALHRALARLRSKVAMEVTT